MFLKFRAEKLRTSFVDLVALSRPKSLDFENFEFLTLMQDMQTPILTFFDNFNKTFTHFLKMPKCSKNFNLGYNKPLHYLQHLFL